MAHDRGRPSRKQGRGVLLVVVVVGLVGALEGAYILTGLMALAAISVPVAGWVARREGEGDKAPPAGVPGDGGHHGGSGF